MTIAWTTLNNAPATLGWTVWNFMRGIPARGIPAVFTKTGIYNAWVAAYDPTGTGNTEPPPLSAVQSGIDYLTAHGFASFDGTTVTPLFIGSDGRPSRLRRTAGSDFALELLPNGSKPTEGT